MQCKSFTCDFGLLSLYIKLKQYNFYSFTAFLYI